jgi:HPt (histidine-containing phosphotransfer) domain-containing protein
MTTQLDVARGIGMMGSEASLRSILKTVETSLVSSLPEIGQALAVDDVKIVNRLLHSIKGYAPIFCTEALAAQVAQVEGASKTETAAVLRPLVAALLPQLELLVTEIRAYSSQG